MKVTLEPSDGGGGGGALSVRGGGGGGADFGGGGAGGAGSEDRSHFLFRLGGQDGKLELNSSRDMVPL
jgi:hypothetical protein